MAPTKGKRRESQKSRDSVKISELYREGIYQAVIANQLGLSQATVSREIKLLRDKWEQEGIDNINQAKVRELEKLDTLELVYWNAWMRSQKDSVVTTKGKQSTGDVDFNRIEKNRDGNKAFLDGVMDCIKQRCAILGVEAPTKIAPTNPTGDQPYDNDKANQSLSALADAIGKIIPSKGK
jgi:predicted transcriptional regulator